MEAMFLRHVSLLSQDYIMIEDRTLHSCRHENLKSEFRTLHSRPENFKSNSSELFIAAAMRTSNQSSELFTAALRTSNQTVQNSS
jgi:hypothetical protein